MLDDLLEKLKKYRREEVAYKAGISLGTLNSLLCGRNTNPTLNVVMALQAFLDEKEKEEQQK